MNPIRRDLIILVYTCLSLLLLFSSIYSGADLGDRINPDSETTDDEEIRQSNETIGPQHHSDSLYYNVSHTDYGKWWNVFDFFNGYLTNPEDYVPHGVMQSFTVPENGEIEELKILMKRTGDRDNLQAFQARIFEYYGNWKNAKYPRSMELYDIGGTGEEGEWGSPGIPDNEGMCSSAAYAYNVDDGTEWPKNTAQHVTFKDWEAKPGGTTTLISGKTYYLDISPYTVTANEEDAYVQAYTIAYLYSTHPLVGYVDGDMHIAARKKDGWWPTDLYNNIHYNKQDGDIYFDIKIKAKNEDPDTPKLEIKENHQTDSNWSATIYTNEMDETVLAIWEDVYFNMQLTIGDPDYCDVRYHYDWSWGTEEWKNSAWYENMGGRWHTISIPRNNGEEDPGWRKYRYYVEDHHGATSETVSTFEYVEENGDTHTIDLLRIKERPPEITAGPYIENGTELIAGSEVTFYINATDPVDAERIRYGWNWTGSVGGNPLTVDEWTSSYFSSGCLATHTHTFENQGSVEIHAIANDTNGAKSEWVPFQGYGDGNGPSGWDPSDPGGGIINYNEPIVHNLGAKVDEENTVSLTGKIIDDGGDTTGCIVKFFRSSTDEDANPGTEIPIGGKILEGESFTYDLSLPGMPSGSSLYAFRITAKNNAYTSNSGTDFFLLRPQGFSYVTVNKINDSTLQARWGNGQGGAGARIRYERTTPPTYTSSYENYIGTSHTFEELLPGHYKFTFIPIAHDNIGTKTKTSDGSDDAPYGPTSTYETDLVYMPNITTEPPENVGSSSFEARGRIEDWGGTECTAWFYYETIPGTGTETTKQHGLVDNDLFTSTIGGFFPGTAVAYYVRGNNSEYGDMDMSDNQIVLTKPTSITPLAETKSITSIQISWSNGMGGDGAYIEYAADVAIVDWGPGDGTPVPTGGETEGYVVGEEYTHEGLEYNQTYWYKVWPYAADSIGEGSQVYISNGSSAQPFGDAVEIHNVTRLKPRFTNVHIENTTNESADFVFFVQDTGSPTTLYLEYGESLAEIDNISTGTYTLTSGEIRHPVEELQLNQEYYYRIIGENVEGETITDPYWFITTPGRPEDFTLDAYGLDEAHLSWEKGIGADKTFIVAQYENYSTDRSEGREVTNTTQEEFKDTNFSDYVDIHYTAWSYNGYINPLTGEIGGIFSHNTAQVNTTVFDYEVILPRYLEVGDYVVSWGKITSRTGQEVVGFHANTTIRDNEGKQALAPISWNCTDGNYQTTVPTTQLEPGEYQICVRFTNEVGTKLLFDYLSPLHLSKELEDDNENTFAPATIYYSFYDIATGTGVDDNYYKVYISSDEEFSEGDRVKGGEITVLRSKSKKIYLGQEYYIQVRDYADNIISLEEYDEERFETYSQDTVEHAYAKFKIRHPEFYVDIGIYLNQMRIKNMNESTTYITIDRTDGNTGQVVGRFIPPGEETEIFLPDGTYRLAIEYYDNEHPGEEPYRRIFPWGDGKEISTDYFVWIPGKSLESIIARARSIDTWLYYSIIDKHTGEKIGDDIYPIYISDDQNITESDRFLGGKVPVAINQTIYFRVTDYWGNVLYPTDGNSTDSMTIEQDQNFLDLAIPLHQYIIVNQNKSLIYCRIRPENATDPLNNTWYNRWIAPGESTELHVQNRAYEMDIEYYNPATEQFIKNESIKNITISTDDLHIIPGDRARVYFTVYDADTGLGIDRSTYKIYLDGVRVPGNYIDTVWGKDRNLTVKDYYNTIIYNTTIDIVTDMMCVDVPLELYTIKCLNMKHDIFVTALNKSGQEKAWEQTIGMYESITYTVPPGTYTITISNETITSINETIEVNETAAYLLYEDAIHTALIKVTGSMRDEVQEEVNAILEEYNKTDPHVSNIIDYHGLFNESINNLRDEFDETQVLAIPDIRTEYKDTIAPQTTITAINTMDGTIRVTWNSIDDNGRFANHTNISYKKENATTWKLWKAYAQPYGSSLFNTSVEELSVGKTYEFRGVSVDGVGNAEKPNTINTISLTYIKEEYGEEWTAESLVEDAASQHVFIIGAVLLVILVIIVIGAERKKEKKGNKMAKEVSTKRPYREEQYDYEDW